MTSPTEIRSDPIPAAFIDEVQAALAQQTYLRRKLPRWGRLHIDRPLPFLCVYRRPPGRAAPSGRHRSGYKGSGNDKIRSGHRNALS